MNEPRAHYHLVMGRDVLRMVKDKFGDDAYVTLPDGKITPVFGFPIYTDCRIATNEVYFDWPDNDGLPHHCDGDNPCSARIREDQNEEIPSD